MEYSGIENPYEAMIEGWSEVSPGVRAGLTPPLEATGTLCVEVGRKGIPGVIARLIQLPPEGEEVTARLTVSPEVNRVRWLREFGSMRAESIQTFRNRTYTEEAGPFRMVFRIDREGQDLLHVQVSTLVFGVKVPRFLGPVVVGRMSAGPDEQSWKLDVDIRHCWFGRICRYRGVMRSR